MFHDPKISFKIQLSKIKIILITTKFYDFKQAEKVFEFVSQQTRKADVIKMFQLNSDFSLIKTSIK